MPLGRCWASSQGSRGTWHVASSASDPSSHVQANSWPIDGALPRCSQLSMASTRVCCLARTCSKSCASSLPLNAAIILRMRTQTSSINKAFDTSCIATILLMDGSSYSSRSSGCPSCRGADASGDMRLCHQLDFATSGLIVAAKSHDSASAVARTFRERDARKLYCALCFGHPSFDVARWEDRIMVSKRRFKQRISSAPRSKTARTDVTVGARGILKLGDDHRGRECAMLWLEPRTGQRHQLQHAAHAGHAPSATSAYTAIRCATAPSCVRQPRAPSIGREHLANQGASRTQRMNERV